MAASGSKPTVIVNHATAADSAASSKPPGPRGLPFFGTSFMASRDPTQTLTRWAQKYGDIVFYRFLKFGIYVLFHPQHVEQILTG